MHNATPSLLDVGPFRLQVEPAGPGEDGLRRRDTLEGWLHSLYGDRPDPGPNSVASRVFNLIDYPAFDNGSMGVGFARVVHGPAVHCWSRAIHYHK